MCYRWWVRLQEPGAQTLSDVGPPNTMKEHMCTCVLCLASRAQGGGCMTKAGKVAQGGEMARQELGNQRGHEAGGDLS